jgi:ribosomal protein S18
MEVALAILVIARDPNAQSKNRRRIALAVRRARKNNAPP